MSSEYQDIRDLLDEHKEEIAKQKKDYEAMTSPDFNPLMVELEGFSRYDLTPDKIHEMLVTNARQDEALIQMQFVESCFERLHAAMAVIEAQMAWLGRVDNEIDPRTKKEAKQCISGDHYAIRELYDQVGVLREYQSKKALSQLADEEDMMERLAVFSIQYRDLNNGILSEEFNKLQTSEELLDRIFQARLGYASITANDIGLTLNKTHNAMQEALLLMVAADEDALTSEEGLKKLIANALKYADRRIKDAEYMVTTTEDFLADLYGMGAGDYGLDAFRVTAYKPVTIEPLDQLSP